jgi:hypothetical protein
MLRTVRATRYLRALRRGSSVPVLAEADDLGIYVVKLRAAGQGAQALVAELVAGELARAAGLRVPELVLVELDAALAAGEPDPEIQLPLRASAGLNVGLDYLPGGVDLDPRRGPFPDAATASRIVLFDAFVANVDRSPKNPNLLLWHSRAWLIDHGAALYFHHGWGAADRLGSSGHPFPEVRHHVLLPHASDLDAALEAVQGALTPETLARVVGDVPAAFLASDDFAGVEAHRAAYVAWLEARLGALPALAAEAREARVRGG